MSKVKKIMLKRESRFDVAVDKDCLLLAKCINSAAKLQKLLNIEEPRDSKTGGVMMIMIADILYNTKKEEQNDN